MRKYLSRSRALILTTLLAAIAIPAAVSAEVIAECAGPEGLSDYFRGEIVTAQPVALAADGGRLFLVREDGAFDLLHEAADGTLRSVRALDTRVEGQESAGGRIYHLMVGQEGFLDHFVFQSNAGGGAGKVMWATQRVETGETTMHSAPCHAG